MLIDVPLEPPQEGKRSHHRIDVLGFQFAAIGKQDQLGRRRMAALHQVGERKQRLTRRGNRRQLLEQLVARRFDAPSDLLFLVRLQQFPFADVIQVHANEVDVLLRQASGRDLLLPAVFGLDRVAVEVLIVERFGLFFFEKPRRLDDGGFHGAGVVERHESEIVGALTPVEHMGIPFWLAPIDEWLGIGATTPDGGGCG
jgi:hypothetical protein